MARLNWAVAPFARKGSWNFIPRGKEREGAHTRLGLETIKVSGIDLKRREIARAEEEEAREGACERQTGEGLLLEGCYERCVQLTVASSVHAVPLATGVVNARGIPTYLRQFLFMADLPIATWDERTLFLANWYRTIILLH